MEEKRPEVWHVIALAMRVQNESPGEQGSSLRRATEQPHDLRQAALPLWAPVSSCVKRTARAMLQSFLATKLIDSALLR